jgi:hypothetical protein
MRWDASVCLFIAASPAATRWRGTGASAQAEAAKVYQVLGEWSAMKSLAFEYSYLYFLGSDANADPGLERALLRAHLPHVEHLRLWHLKLDFVAFVAFARRHGKMRVTLKGVMLMRAPVMAESHSEESNEGLKKILEEAVGRGTVEFVEFCSSTGD